MDPAVVPEGGSGPRGAGIPPLSPRVAVTIAGAVVVAVVFALAAGAVRPFIVGVILVYLLAPLVERLARAGLPRGLAALAVLLGAIVAIVVVATLALSPLIAQARAFFQDLPHILADIRAGLLDFYQGLALAPEVREQVDAWLAELAAGASGLDLGAIVSPVVGSLVSALSAVAAFLVLPAWLFFVLRDRIRFADRLEASLPVEWRGDVFATLAIADRVFGKWVRGQLLLGAIVGIASFVGLLILSVVVDPVFARYAVLLALIAGVFELIPYIGPILSAIPAALIGATAGPAGVIAVVLLYLVIQQLENHILVPVVQGDAVELHPAAVIVALVVGAGIGGFIGAIISLPIAAAGRDLFRYAFHRVDSPPSTVDEALGSISPRLVSSVRRSAVDASSVTTAAPPTAAPEVGMPSASPGEPSAGPGEPPATRDRPDAATPSP